MSDSPRFPHSFSDSLSAALEAHLRNVGGRQCGNLQRLVVSAVEETLADFALQKCGGNCSEAAKLLGISRTTLMRKKNGVANGGDNGVRKTARRNKNGGGGKARKNGGGAR